MEKNNYGLLFGMVFHLPLRAIVNTEATKSYCYDKDFLKIPFEEVAELWSIGKVYQDGNLIVCEVQK